ncbi:patatin-like phospholipase family protein [Salipaludibacillus daqingensis]|uniref:patatin-like phospholipase family protein n=1 Tax=Salipaludibacillus daqingensis TaxID=3041001 RepID=UPI0024735FE1|nr:patatin-like phospholipase family protein [Salipaludibacillus daqingensis]
MKVDAVFAGGGVKALAFSGAFQELKKKNITFERVAGTSAGALTAALIKAGYEAEEMNELFSDMDLREFLDPRVIGNVFPFLRWVMLYRKMGLYKGVTFEMWLEKVLSKKGVKTFGDLPEGSLKMVASDITNGRFIVLPDDLPRYGIDEKSFSVAKAVRMSASLPYFFEPVKLKNEHGEEALIVDGGVLSNFPIWLFIRKREKRERPVLGLRLSPEYDQIPPRKINNGLSFLHSMFETMRTAHDQRYVTKLHAKNIIFIPVKEVTSTHFNMSEDEKHQLILLGKQTTKDFLKTWSY